MNARGSTVVLLLSLALARPVAAEPKWERVDTPNFIVMGSVGESRLRAIGTQFEGFRDALTRLLSSGVTRTAVPTVVVAFGDERSFQPFKPVFEGKPVDIGGLFVARQHVNYILIGPQRVTDALRPVFHEYTHLVVNNVVPELPVWLNEGIAEYYSTFELGNDGREVTIGKPIDAHYRTLGTEAWMPLDQLLATKHDSPQYNENSRRGVFYAESWMLVHMLLHGQPDRRVQLGAYVHELSTGVESGTAWQHQFGREDLYRAVRVYAGRSLVSASRFTLPDQVMRTPITHVALQPADVENTLGELLIALGHTDAAAKRFDRALELQPGSARALLGKASVSASTAVPSNDALGDWFADYMVGATLLDRVSDRASVEAARAALERAAKIRDDIPNIHALYARAIETLAGDATLAIDGLKRALEAVPARDDYAFQLARCLALGRQYAAARAVLGQVIARPHLPGSRDAAFSAMRQVVALEQSAQARVEPDRRPADTAPVPPPPENPPGRAVDPEVRPVYRVVQPGERRVEGFLERIDCSPKGIEFVVRLDDRVARFHAPAFDKVDFITYRNDLQGRVTCGPRRAPDRVYVTSRPGSLEGTVVAMEFLATK